MKLKLKRNGFHRNAIAIHENKDSKAAFIQLFNILCKLAQFYCTQ